MATAFRFAAVLLPALLAAPLAWSQGAGQDNPRRDSPQVQQKHGIDYINGGIGLSARAQIAHVREDFPLKMVFSTPSGNYLVADHVSIRHEGERVLAIDDVGPMLLVKLEPGLYQVRATYEGRTEERDVRVGRQPHTLNLRFPAA